MVWAAIMFVASTDAFSAQNTERILAPILRWFYAGITQEQLNLANYIVRKSAHLAEYFVLYVLVYRGLSNRRARWRGSLAFSTKTRRGRRHTKKNQRGVSRRTQRT